jgi:S1-C subfamily serine protease
VRAAILSAALVTLVCRPVEEPPAASSASGRGATSSAAPPAKPAPTSASPGLPAFAAVAERMGPSVVAVIATVVPRDEGEGARVLRGIGAGVIVSANGQVVTNEHVVATADRVDVQLHGNRRVGARVIVRDPLLDLSLLQLDGRIEGLVPVRIREREAVPGEWVMAIGQPYGLGNTVTVGVVSGLRRDWSDLGRPAGLRPDGIWAFIQTDASINIGNSGGPLVDADGEVVGITTAVRRDGQGLAFAVPGEMVRHFVDEAWTFGRIRHARLGIRADDIGGEQAQGRASAVHVTHVDPGGPAAAAGLLAGDLVLAVDDRPITRVSELAYLSQLRGVGATIDLTIARGDEDARHLVLIPDEAP